MLFVGDLAGELNESLPPPFFAVPEERVYVIPPARNVYPDAMILKRIEADAPVHGGVALLERPAPDAPETVSLLADTVREQFIEIRTKDEDAERIVAVIELLSPSNKAANSIGRKEYTEKQDEIIKSHVHLLEVDLLRAGAYTLAVPEISVETYGPWDYLVSLHDAGRPNDFSFWRCSLRHPLPRVTIPLDSGVADATLDLQAALRATYARGPFVRRIDYSRDPVPPLSPEDAAWADALLREAGLRAA